MQRNSAGQTAQIHRAIVARMDWLGHTDPSFNGGVGFTLGSGLGYTWGQHISITPDLICVAGQQIDDVTGRQNFYALQLDGLNGGMRTSFGNTGLAVRPLPDPSLSAYNMAACCLQADGFVTFAGSARPSGSGAQPPVIIRLDDRGAFDHRFGNNGVWLGLQHSLPLYGVVIHPDGDAIAGVPLDPNSNSIQLLRAGNTLETSTIPVPTPATLVPRKMFSYADSLFIAGHSVLNGSRGYFLMKLDADGQIDTSFGQQGLILDSFNVPVGLSALHVSHHGICVVGNCTTIPNSIAVARHTLTGQVDGRFSGDGKLTVAYQHLNGVHVTAVAIHPNGFTYVAGEADKQVFLAAFELDGSVFRSFGEDSLQVEPGTLLLDKFDLADAQSKPVAFSASALAVSDSGHLVLSGTSREDRP